MVGLVMCMLNDINHSPGPTAAVYSGEFTSGSGHGGFTQPLPWCVIAGRLMGKKAREHSKLKAEIASLKEQ